MTSSDNIAMTRRYQMENYSRHPVVFVRGEGVRLFDAGGREYLDFLGGIAVALLGHSHPRVVDAVCSQARTLTHVSNLFHVPVQAELGELLSGAAGGGKVVITSYSIHYTKLYDSPGGGSVFSVFLPEFVESSGGDASIAKS